jgi:hypothetical protein
MTVDALHRVVQRLPEQVGQRPVEGRTRQAQSTAHFRFKSDVCMDSGYRRSPGHIRRPA